MAFPALALGETTKEQAYCGGYDAGMNGPNTTNCNFRLFATPELKDEWERGKKLGDQHRLDAASSEGEKK